MKPYLNLFSVFLTENSSVNIGKGFGESRKNAALKTAFFTISVTVLLKDLLLRSDFRQQLFPQGNYNFPDRLSLHHCLRTRIFQAYKTQSRFSHKPPTKPHALPYLPKHRLQGRFFYTLMFLRHLLWLGS